jgi:hypothetical protein
MSTQTPPGEVSESEKRAALDFALRSESLARSERLKCLLSYICEAEFAGHADQLTEYDIAVSALGRRTNFSPVEDSAVRSRTHELRQKLERLYALEAPDYPVHIDLPKGSYKPRFQRNDFPAEEPASTSQKGPPAGSAAPKSWSIWPFVTGSFVLGVAVTLIVGWVYSSSHPASVKPELTQASRSDWTPELRELWSPLTSSPRPVVLAFETRLFVGFANSPVVVRDPDVENMQDLESSESIMNIKRILKGTQPYEARRYADFSAVNASFLIARLLSMTGMAMKAERSSDMSIDDFRTSNFVLLGKPGAFDGVSRMPPSAFNFVYEGRERSIRNLHPNPGEQNLYVRSGAGGAAETGSLIEEYALIRMTPGAEKGQRILNLVSAESELFWPLGLYLTDPVYAKQLVDHLRLPSGKLPEAYEVLVKAEVRSLKPVSISYVTHRVLEK